MVQFEGDDWLPDNFTNIVAFGRIKNTSERTHHSSSKIHSLNGLSVYFPDVSMVKREHKNLEGTVVSSISLKTPQNITNTSNSFLVIFNRDIVKTVLVNEIQKKS